MTYTREEYTVRFVVTGKYLGSIAFKAVKNNIKLPFLPSSAIVYKIGEVIIPCNETNTTVAYDTGLNLFQVLYFYDIDSSKIDSEVGYFTRNGWLIEKGEKETSDVLAE